MKIEVEDELIEKLSAENPSEYLTKLVEMHVGKFEGVRDATATDVFLMHLFLARLEDPERILMRARAKAREVGKERPKTGDIFVEQWRKLGPEDRLAWADFVKKWQSPFYKDRPLGELASAFMLSETVAEFCGKVGLSYSVASKNVVPRLRALGIPDWVLEVFDYRYLGWEGGKPKR